MRIYVGCVGCEQRMLEAQRIIDYLCLNSLEFTTKPGLASLAIVFTCGIDPIAQKESIEHLRWVMNSATDCDLVIAGCLPFMNSTAVSEFSPIANISPRSLHRMDTILKTRVSIPFSKVPTANRSCFDRAPSNGESYREKYDAAKAGFKIVINRGCLSKCAYCPLRRVLGSLESEPVDRILEQVQKGERAQEPTVMLLGGDVGAYGRDIGTDFPTLLHAVLNIGENFQIYIHDYNMQWLLNDLSTFINVLRTNATRVGACSIPIQSGSDKILRNMRRNYTRSEAIKAMCDIKEASPNTGLGTHIIIGFPGESEIDFADTCDFLTTAPLDFVSCFAYVDHIGADSYNLPGKVPRSLVTERIERLLSIHGEKIKLYGV